MADNILLTGGAGFIGHHTVEHILKTTDYNIVILDNLNYAGNLNYLADIDVLKNPAWDDYKKRVRIIYHDLRSPISPLTAHLIGDIDYVIHMAAESHVDNSIKDPFPFVMSNVVGTFNVLEYCRKLLSLRRMIYVSTDEVYGPSIDGHLHKEGESHKPGNPYSASKAGAEDLCVAYYNTYDLPVIISNTMNNFGERQHYEKFVPKVIRSLLLKEPIVAHCKLGPNNIILDISSRCWLHARNHADALLYLLSFGQVGERYNVTGDRYSVVEIARKISGYMNISKGDTDIKFEDFHSFRKGHDMHYGLDGSKLADLGWKAPRPFEESLEKTVLWYLSNKKWLGLDG